MNIQNYSNSQYEKDNANDTNTNINTNNDIGNVKSNDIENIKNNDTEKVNTNDVKNVNDVNLTKRDLFNHLFAKDNILCYKSSFTNQIFFHVCEPTPASKLFEIDFKNNNLSKDMVRVDTTDGDYEDIVEKYGNIFTTSFYLLYVFRINVGAKDLEIIFDRSKFIDSNPMPELLNGDTVSINKKEYKNLIEVIDSTRDLYSSSVSSINSKNTILNSDDINTASNNMFSGSLSPFNYTILSNLSDPFLAGVVVNDFIYFDNFPRISITPHVKENLIEAIFSNRDGNFQKIWSKKNSKKNQNLMSKETDMLEFDDSMAISIKKILDYYEKEFELEEKLTELNVSASKASTQNISTHNNPFSNVTSEIPSITGTVVYDGEKFNVELDNEVASFKAVDNKAVNNEMINKEVVNDEVVNRETDDDEKDGDDVNGTANKVNKTNKDDKTNNSVNNITDNSVNNITDNSVNNITSSMPTFASRFKKRKYIFNINEKFHIRELLLAYEPYNEKMTDKIKFYYGVKLYNNTMFWRNNSFPVFLGSSYKADCGIKVVGFRGEFEGELLTFNEMRELEKNGLTDGSIVILVGCLDEALRLNNCKSNIDIVVGDVYYLHIIPRNAESRKLLKLYNNSPLELFGGSCNKIDIL